MTARSRTALWLAIAFLSVLPRSAWGQIIDARLIPSGVLRIGFSPQYQSWDHMFGQDGSSIPLGNYLSADSAGANVFSTLANAQSAIRSITGDQNFRFNIGTLKTLVDADLRRFPFEASVGLNSRLTVNVTVPIVVTRVNTGISLDTTHATDGFNQAPPAETGNFNASGLNAQLLAQLDASATALTIQIASGGYGCPSGPSCAQAQAVLARTRSVRNNLAVLFNSNPLPALMPTYTSPAGQAMHTALVSLSTDLQSLGVPGVTADFLSLPSRLLSNADVRTTLGDSVYGYVTTIPPYSKHPHLGNVEIGVRYGLVQKDQTRFVLNGFARLPTQDTDSPNNLVDITTGEANFAGGGGFESALEAGPVSLTTAGSYLHQFTSANLIRRVTAPQNPVAFYTTTSAVSRKPGDTWWVNAYPAIQLAEGFRIHGLVSYFHKGSDQYSGAVSLTGQPVDASLLGQQTAMEALSLGGGISYRSLAIDTRLPIDAGLTFQTSTSGSGGFTPNATVITIYLRTYYRLWGQRPPPRPRKQTP
jgi:hypothetical protein